MFTDLLEINVELCDHDLDAAIRDSELAHREHAARHAALLAVARSRGLFGADGHRSMPAYLRATVDVSGGRITDHLKLARLLDAHPTVGDGLLAGRFGVDHAMQIARIHSNRRIASLLPLVVDVYVDLAEHRSYAEFRGDIDEFIQLADQDGAFADLAAAVEGRDAQVSDVGGTLAVWVSGGDPITTAQFVAVFDRSPKASTGPTSRRGVPCSATTPTNTRCRAPRASAVMTRCSRWPPPQPHHQKAAPCPNR